MKISSQPVEVFFVLMGGIVYIARRYIRHNRGFL